MIDLLEIVRGQEYKRNWDFYPAFIILAEEEYQQALYCITINTWDPPQGALKMIFEASYLLIPI